MSTRTLADERIIEIMFILMELNEIASQAKFCQRIGAEKYIITKIRKGEMSFTISQIEKTIYEFGINANFVFGVEKNVLRDINNSPLINKILRSLRAKPEKIA